MLTGLLEKVVRHEDLTADEAAAAMREVMEGRAAPATLGALLSGLVMKGERPSEIVGFARTMREHAVKLVAPIADVFDTCGTGGDKMRTFNISTTAAFVVAGAGITVAKHGGRSVSSSCGSADVLKALDVKIDLLPEKVEEGLNEIGIGFLFAPNFHLAMRHAAGPRQEIGVRTIFNMLGPLTNPAGARAQLVGVYAPGAVSLVAESLSRLGVRHAPPDQ